MSRASRRAAGRHGGGRSVEAPELAPKADMSFPFGGIGYGTMGYQGAAYSNLRGYVYWPTLDPQKEIDSWSRLEIARKVHWARANIGLARRILTGLTNLIVGTGLVPHAATTDEEWNQLAENAYKSRSNSPLAYSVNGRHTSAQGQRLIVGTRLTDGDAAVVFASSQSGGALRQFYSGTQIGSIPSISANPAPGGEDWHDGIRYDALDRAMTYRFPSPDGKTWTDIDAENVRFLCRYETPGQRRGVSALAHAVNKMVDLTELNTFLMQGIKTSSQIGYYLKSDSKDKPQGMDAAFGDPVTRQKIKTAGGKEVEVSLKNIYGQGGLIPSLPEGISLETLLDTRPHPNSQAFVEEFIRDISWGTGISMDLLWNIYKLGGANVRYILADAQVFVGAEQQDLVDTWLSPDWCWTIAKEMKAGRLRRCKDPVWWAHGWIPPARVTVDYGRDGRIMLDFHKYGLLTTTRFYGMQGLTARKEITGELELVAWRKSEMERLKLVPIDLQLYNPMIARMTPEMKGEQDYAEEVPTGNRPTGKDDGEDDDFDSSTSQERLHATIKEMIREEQAQITYAKAA